MELIGEFGCSGSKKNACTALPSVAYDVIEHVSHDCQIGRYSLSERDLLNKHLDRLENFTAEKFLTIADREYPSYDLVDSLIDRTFSFLLRLSESWTNIISWMNDTRDKEFQYEYRGNTYTFRALKITLEDKAKDEHKSLKYLRQANRRQCIGRIVPVFLECIFTDSERKRIRLWKQVEQFCHSFSEHIRPGRNPKRKTPRDRKFYPNARKTPLS